MPVPFFLYPAAPMTPEQYQQNLHQTQPQWQRAPDPNASPYVHPFIHDMMQGAFPPDTSPPGST